MEAPKISIIVPVYNVEKYLRKCLDSISAQTFTDWECLLIDDGSPDNSGAICDEYAVKDSRFKVFHKPNGGVSSARNLGLDMASGEWVTFIDSDDIIAITYLENLVQPIIKDKSLDFVHGGFSFYYNQEIAGIGYMPLPKVGSDKSYLLNNFQGYITSKLFHMGIINSWKKDEKLAFDENMKIAEDYAFTLDYLCKVEKYCFIDKIGYYYRRDNVISATNTSRNYQYIYELTSFRHRSSSMKYFLKQSHISENNCVTRLKEIGDSLMNTVFALYRSGDTKRAYRISHIKNDFTEDDYKFLKYSINISTKGVLSALLKARCFLLFDLLTCFAFMIKNAKK